MDVRGNELAQVSVYIFNKREVAAAVTHVAFKYDLALPTCWQIPTVPHFRADPACFSCFHLHILLIYRQLGITCQV